MRLQITGQVQGAGFRPFVYRLARGLGLVGSVCNTIRGLLIEVQGPAEDIAFFQQRLRSGAPGAAVLEEVTTEEIPRFAASAFCIAPSCGGGEPQTRVPPDLRMCLDCASAKYANSPTVASAMP